MDGNGESVHVLVIPYPTQGHVTPMMQLAKKLASKGLIVTFVTTHHRHAQIAEAHSCSEDPLVLEARNLGLDIRSAQISDGLPLDFDRSSKFYDFMHSVDNMGEALEDLITHLNKRGPPISCVIADTLLFWSLDVAKKLGIQWVSFWTQPVAVYSIYYHFHMLKSRGHYRPGKTGHCEDWIDYIPGVSKIQPRDLPSFLQHQDSGSDYVLDMLLKSFQSSRVADLVLCNSFSELEPESVHAMNTISPVVTVGPLLPPVYLETQNSNDTIIGTSFWTEYNPSEWLDTKPKGSVIYVSFGSLVHVSKAQIEEIAMGLEDSGKPFLWVLRPDVVASEVSDILPVGFMENIEGQGLLVSWSPQLKVLSHMSVGGFFTHCGWNSVMEAISMAVPMLGFPLWSDQYTNCKLVVDEWNIGLRLRGGHGDERVIRREEISWGVREVMDSEQGVLMKSRVTELRDRATIAVKEGGSSHNNLEAFVEGLKLDAHRTENRSHKSV